MYVPRCKADIPPQSQRTSRYLHAAIFNNARCHTQQKHNSYFVPVSSSSFVWWEPVGAKGGAGVAAVNSEEWPWRRVNGCAMIYCIPRVCRSGQITFVSDPPLTVVSSCAYCYSCKIYGLTRTTEQQLLTTPEKCVSNQNAYIIVSMHTLCGHEARIASCHCDCTVLRLDR